MDYVLVEGEAEKVAREAAAALKKSRRQCMNALSGVPNWTGQQGGGMSNSRSVLVPVGLYIHLSGCHVKVASIPYMYCLSTIV